MNQSQKLHLILKSMLRDKGCYSQDYEDSLDLLLLYMYSNFKLKQFSLCTSFSNLFQLKSKRSLILGEANSSPSIHHSRHLPAFTRFVGFVAIFHFMENLLQFCQRTCSKSCPCNDPDSLRWQRISSAGPRTSNNPAPNIVSKYSF